MDPIDVEAVVTIAGAALSEELQIELIAVCPDCIVLPRNLEDMAGLDRGEHLLHGVELLRGAGMSEVAGVHDEGWARRQGVDLPDRLPEGGGDVRVGGPLEADVAV